MVKLIITLIVVMILTIGLQPKAYAFDLNLFVSESWHELNEDEKKEIALTTDKYITLLKAESYEDAYNLSHPELKRVVSKEEFLRKVNSLKPRFAKANSISLSDARIVSFKLKAAKDPKIVLSGSAKQTDPSHIQFYTIPGIKKQGLVFYKVQSDTVDRLLTLTVGMLGSVYKILSVYLNPIKFKGKGTEYYENLGIKWANEKKYVTSLYAYIMALKFSTPGPNIHTANSIRIGKKIQKFLKNPEIKSKLLSWHVEKNVYQILKFDTLETINDVSPTLAYISKFQLEEKEISKEANMLIKYMKANNPDFGNHFEALLFQAYTENPVSPKKKYPFYRLVHRIN